MRGDGVATPAVVLSVRPLGEADLLVVLLTAAAGKIRAEADLLVVLLTAAAGKIRAAAASARKSRRRFPGGLSGGAVGQAALVPRARGLWRLESFQPTLEHASLGRDLHRFAYVAYLCELTDVLVVEPEPDPACFAALAHAIASTIAAPADPAVLRAYELRLLSTLGLLPALSSCAVCGRDVPDEADAPEVALDERRGGVLCREHAEGARRVPTELVVLGLDLSEAVSEAAPERETAAIARFAAAPPAVRRALRDLLQTCIRPQLRRPLRSLDFFAKLGTKG